MQTRFNAQAITDQCLELVTGDEVGAAHFLIHEDGTIDTGVVQSFSNHFTGRLKLHLYSGRYVTWRLPQHIIDTVSSMIHVDGNDAKLIPRGSHV